MLSTPSQPSSANTNLNAQGSVYSRQYGHAKSDLVARAMAGRKKKKKIYDSSPRQFRP
jgi:hypothetical protein